MNKKQLSEQEIRSRYILLARLRAGWKAMQIREAFYFTDGRMNVQPNGRAVRVGGIWWIIGLFTTM